MAYISPPKPVGVEFNVPPDTI